MRHQKILLLPILLILPLMLGTSVNAKPAKAKTSCDMTLEEFMKTKIKATVMSDDSEAEQNKKLTKYFEALIDLAPKDSWNKGGKGWNKIVNKTIKSQSWGAACKNCHSAYQDKYQKSYRSQKICIDPKLLK